MNKINTVAQQLLLPGPRMAIPGGVREGQSSLVINEGRVPLMRSIKFAWSRNGNSWQGSARGRSPLVINEGRVPQTPSKDLQAFDPATKHYLMFSGSPS